MPEHRPHPACAEPPCPGWAGWRGRQPLLLMHGQRSTPTRDRQPSRTAMKTDRGSRGSNSTVLRRAVPLCDERQHGGSSSCTSIGARPRPGKARRPRGMISNSPGGYSTKPLLGPRCFRGPNPSSCTDLRRKHLPRRGNAPANPAEPRRHKAAQFHHAVRRVTRV